MTMEKSLVQKPSFSFVGSKLLSLLLLLAMMVVVVMMTTAATTTFAVVLDLSFIFLPLLLLEDLL